MVKEVSKTQEDTKFSICIDEDKCFFVTETTDDKFYVQLNRQDLLELSLFLNLNITNVK